MRFSFIVYGRIPISRTAHNICSCCSGHVSQIPQCTSLISHNTPFCVAQICRKMVHCGVFVWCNLGLWDGSTSVLKFIKDTISRALYVYTCILYCIEVFVSALCLGLEIWCTHCHLVQWYTEIDCSPTGQMGIQPCLSATLAPGHLISQCSVRRHKYFKSFHVEDKDLFIVQIVITITDHGPGALCCQNIASHDIDYIE